MRLLTFLSLLLTTSVSALPYLLLSALILATFVHLLLQLLNPRFSVLRHLPGPKSKSWIWGNVLDIISIESGERHRLWEEEFGHVYAYRELGNRYRLCTLDPRALSHILSNAYSYPKPTAIQRSLSRALGEGLLVAEGDVHKRQRRVMNPCFGLAQIRELVPVFWDKAGEMGAIWEKLLSDEETKGAKIGEGEGVVIDVTKWMSRVTLDIIGLAGFGYAFESLTDAGNPLSLAFQQLLDLQKPTFAGLAVTVLPWLRWLPLKRNRVERSSLRTMRQIGLELVRRKKEAVRQTLDGKREEKDIARNMLAGRDLLTAMVRANMAHDVPAQQRLDDEEVLAQISTFLLAGHETTSTAVTWALFALSRFPEVQRKLRQELLACLAQQPEMDELSQLPYLDAFVREVLRFYPPVPGTPRIAAEDDEIPLSRPFRDVRGREHTSIRIRKGDGLFIPLKRVNRSPLLWGPDGEEFRPERWLAPSSSPSPSEAAAGIQITGQADAYPGGESTIPGLWSHQLTFLGGPRACIGYRFSIIEIKVFLYSLVRKFEYEFADKNAEWEARSAVVSRPHVKGRVGEGPMLPLRVRRVRAEETV